MTERMTDSEKLNTSHHLLGYIYDIADDYEASVMDELLERVGYQKSCECGALIYHDTGHCPSCERSGGAS